MQTLKNGDEGVPKPKHVTGSVKDFIDSLYFGHFIFGLGAYRGKRNGMIEFSWGGKSDKYTLDELEENHWMKKYMENMKEGNSQEDI